MRVSKLFGGRFLQAKDLDGRPIVLIIAKLIEEKMEGSDDLKPVAYFEKAKKGLVFNKTNALSIAEFAGDDMDSWPGTAVELYPARTSFSGKEVDCIRVRQPAAQEEAEKSDAIPF